MRWMITLALTLAIALMGAGTIAHAEGPEQGKPHRGHMLGTSAHQSMYMQLLAEKYTPEAAAAWKQTMEERFALMKTLHELQSSQKRDKDSARGKLKKFMEQSGDTMKGHRALVKEFTNAVQMNDEAAIKAVLPKLLQSEQKLNATLRKWVESEKQAKSS
jgi:hypothetical protein